MIEEEICLRTKMNEKVFKSLIHEINKYSGLNLDKEILENSPRRIRDSLYELLDGYLVNIESLFKNFEMKGYKGITGMGNINFYSICSHHLLVFEGKAHVYYLPSDNGNVLGASKIIRLVNAFAHRLQLQERITMQIADALYDSPLKPKVVYVMLEASHDCFHCRGTKNPDAIFKTSEQRGIETVNQDLKNELMSMVYGGK